MEHVPATIRDFADTRAYECLLPTGVPVIHLANCFARFLKLPTTTPGNDPVNYGFICVNGRAIDPNSTIESVSFSDRLEVRLVPEIIAAGEGLQTKEYEIANFQPVDKTKRPGIRVIRSYSLAEEAEYPSKMDIRMDARVHREIEQFASNDRMAECAGLLLGTVQAEDGVRVIHIKAVIPALDAEGSRTNVRINLKAWESMLSIRDKDYPNLQLLGWLHTHAGWGVFLSDADVFIHRAFFSDKNMVAYVMDPTIGKDAIFYWRQDKIALAPSFGLVGTPEELYEDKKTKTAVSKIWSFAWRGLIIASLSVGTAYLVFSNDIKGIYRERINHQPAAKTVVRKAYKKPATDIYTVYVLIDGETLWSVCDRVYGNGGLASALAEYNEISNINNLQVGQKIKLPSKEILLKVKELKSH